MKRAAPRWSSFGLLVLAVAGGSAAGGCKAKPEPAPQSAASVTSAPALLAKPGDMLRHEMVALAIRDAVVRGDLPAAQRNAFALARLGVFDGGTPEYQERAVELRHAAASIAASLDLRQAALGAGALAKTCADCHARLSGPTRIDVEPAPHVEPGARARMQRHAWAMNELWNGMIGNSEPPWHEGAVVLADPALRSSELTPEKTSSPAVDALARSVHDLGGRAVAASDPDVRAVVYGELLTTCADCHTRTR